MLGASAVSERALDAPIWADRGYDRAARRGNRDRRLGRGPRRPRRGYKLPIEEAPAVGAGLVEDLAHRERFLAGDARHVGEFRRHGHDATAQARDLERNGPVGRRDLDHLALEAGAAPLRPAT